MARLKLHKSYALGDYEVYPVYEINYNRLKEMTGYQSIISNNNVSPNANKFRRWQIINNNIKQYTDQFPRQATESGNILQCDTRYNNQISDRYYMPQATIESFAAVQQGVQPEDWGANPNYVILKNITQSFNDSPGGGFGSVNVCVPIPVNIHESWDSSTSYYEDTKRFLVRKFFLEDGKSFSISKGGYYNSDRYCGISFGNGTLTSFRSGSNGYDSQYVGYYFTRDDNSVIDRTYKTEYAYGITNIDNNPDNSWPTWQNGKNITQFFVHYFDEAEQTDFYGIAMAQFDNFLETCIPIALDIVVFDAQWWGSSVIPGGGGSGQWTNDGPISYVQGGRGNFYAPSDNRGDRSGTKASAIKDEWNNAETSLTTTGYNRYVLGVDSSLGIDDSNAFGQFCQQLWDPDFWDSLTNKFYNPISSILVSHMMPEELAPPLTTGQATRDHIYAAQTNLTPDYTVSRFLRKNISKHIGDIDISNYTDSFADYTNTAIYIHLPYVGTYQLDISACMGGWLSVDYLVDAFTGDITALITTCDKDGNSQLRYSWKGNCAKDMPIQQRISPWTGLATGLAKTAVIAAINVPMAIASGVGEVMSAGGLTVGEALKATWYDRADMFPSLGKDVVKTAGASVMTGIGNAAQSALQSSLITTSSNAEGGSLTSPIDTQCWVLISRPQWSAPDEYGKLFGYPSDIGGTINHSDTEVGDPFTNFLSVRSIKLDNIAATNEEKAEIYNLMTTGVFTTND